MNQSVASRRLEMGYTPLEFRKTLSGQFIKNTPFSLVEISQQEWLVYLGPNALQTSHAHQQAHVNIKIAEAAPRKIAMLTLPVLETIFEFNALSAHQETEFMHVFFRYFHKGGG